MRNFCKLTSVYLLASGVITNILNLDHQNFIIIDKVEYLFLIKF